MKFLGAIVLLVWCCSAADAPDPDLVLTGVITRADYHTYREVPFTVPPGITRLTIEFSYTTRDQHTTIDLGLLDGERFRGWSGGNKSTFTLSETDATPSYLPGPIRPGLWKLLLGIPNIREGVRAEFQAKIYFSRSAGAAPVSTFSTAPLKTQPAWYRGDLHMHTAHSDGSCPSESGRSVPCPVFKTVEAAENRGLDFIAITDHNTTSQYDALRELQPYFDRLLLIAGREITTFEGHANVYGTTQFIDFRVTGPLMPDVKALLKQVRALNALISINHPADPSGEACMGCGWTAPDTDFREIQAIEAVNGGDPDTPRSGIPFWEAQLNRGFRLTAIGGSDNHRATVTFAVPSHWPPGTPNLPSSVGHPTTVVYANNLSENAILDGVRSGRVFIDVEGAGNRLLDLSAKSGSSATPMGSPLRAPKDTVVQFSVHVAGANGARLEVIEDSQPLNLDLDPAIQQDDDVKTFSLRVDGARHWLRINVRSPEGRLLLLSNPVYLNF